MHVPQCSLQFALDNGQWVAQWHLHLLDAQNLSHVGTLDHNINHAGKRDESVKHCKKPCIE